MRVRRGRGFAVAFAFLWGILGTVAGCKSPFVEVTLVNQGPTVHVLELDYPNASFGVNQLARGAKYSYRLKIQGQGQLSLQYDDASGKTHTFQGPKVNAGDQGSLVVQIDPAGAVDWKASLTNRR